MPSEGKWRDIMSCHVKKSKVKSFHVMSREVKWSHVMSCHVKRSEVMPCQSEVMSCHVKRSEVRSCHVMSCHVKRSEVKSCNVMSCHVMSREVKWSHVMSREVKWSHVMPSEAKNDVICLVPYFKLAIEVSFLISFLFHTPSIKDPKNSIPQQISFKKFHTPVGSILARSPSNLMTAPLPDFQ